MKTSPHVRLRWYIYTQCNTVQHSATKCNTLQHAAQKQSAPPYLCAPHVTAKMGCVLLCGVVVPVHILYVCVLYACVLFGVRRTTHWSTTFVRMSFVCVIC